MSKLYQSHIPLSAVSKALLGVGSAAAAILNPARGDMVAAMGEATAAGPVLENLRRRMESDVCGQQLLSDRPRITDETINREWLDGLPEGTLGKEYSNFLDRLHTHPDARPAVKFIDDQRHLYVMQRYRETHDFNHVVLQQPTNMIGEVTVKYFEAIQFGLPMCTAAAIFGAARLRPKHRQQLLDVNLPWVVEQAKRARLFMCVDWEKRFEQPLEDLQEELGIRPIGRL